MPAAEFSHSVGVLLTHQQTSPFPDEHSFVVGDGTLIPSLGFGHSGWVPPPSRNPPEGNVTTCFYNPVPGAKFSERDMDAIAELLKLHRDKYNEARIYVADGIPNHAEINRWVSAGAIAGTTVGRWGTSQDPDDEPSIEEQAA